MPRLDITVSITEEWDIDLDQLPVDQLIRELQEAQEKAKEQGATQIYTNNDMEYEGSYGKFRVMAVRPETLEEMLFREDKIKGMDELAKSRRLATYESLKKEFG
jgi:hypothetical protein